MHLARLVLCGELVAEDYPVELIRRPVRRTDSCRRGGGEAGLGFAAGTTGECCYPAAGIEPALQKVSLLSGLNASLHLETHFTLGDSRIKSSTLCLFCMRSQWHFICFNLHVLCISLVQFNCLISLIKIQRICVF